MLERNFKSAPLARSQGHRRPAQHPAGFPQNHLIQVVGEFHGDRQTLNGLLPGVHNFSIQCSDFLMQEILGAA